MTKKNKERMILALENAAEMIRGHVECGVFPEEVDEEDEKGIDEYKKACYKVAKMLGNMTKRYLKALR